MSFISTLGQGARVIATVAQKKSPEILLGIGIVSVTAAAIGASGCQLKAEAILESHEEGMKMIEEASQYEEYTEEDKKQDTVKRYAATAKDLVCLYGPWVLLFAAGIGCILGSHGIMRKRNASLVAAYNALDQAYRAYRKRVSDEYGDEKEHDIRRGLRNTKIEKTITDEKGKEKKQKVAEKTIDEHALASPYAKFFDEMASGWKKDPEYNLMFLKSQQAYANDLLRSRGHVFLNEVYDMLGIPRTQAGQAVGWIMGNGDDYIDFGLTDGYRESVRDFVNGYERSILLDFNVDGVIWDKI